MTKQPTSVTSDLWIRLWHDAGTASDTAVDRYLASRGLTLPIDAPLRFHPACPRDKERLPAMLALMTDPMTAEPCGIHRTFLLADGSGKAKSGTSKMMLGRAGVIRLVPEEDVTSGLGIAEGIETALSVMQGAGWRPVWAAGNAGGIAKFPVLGGIEAITIFADADDKGAGLQSAHDCARRWFAAGRDATVQQPPIGMDWHDALRKVA